MVGFPIYRHTSYLFVFSYRDLIRKSSSWRLRLPIYFSTPTLATQISVEGLAVSDSGSQFTSVSFRHISIGDFLAVNDSVNHLLVIAHDFPFFSVAFL